MSGTKKLPYRIPFDGKDMLEYTTHADGEVVSVGKQYRGDAPTEWRENVEFAASVEVEGTSRGRSAARIHCRNKANGETYSMGLEAFHNAVILFGAEEGGTIIGTWKFRKQGANYSLWPIDPES